MGLVQMGEARCSDARSTENVRWFIDFVPLLELHGFFGIEFGILSILSKSIGFDRKMYNACFRSVQ